MTKEEQLIEASRLGDRVLVEKLVKQGTYVNTDNDLALRYASEHGHWDVVKCLVVQGANIRAENNEAIRHAHRNGHEQVADYLIDHLNYREYLSEPDEKSWSSLLKLIDNWDKGCIYNALNYIDKHLNRWPKDANKSIYLRTINYDHSHEEGGDSWWIEDFSSEQSTPLWLTFVQSLRCRTKDSCLPSIFAKKVELLSSLKELDLSGCSSLQTIDGISHLRSVENLHLGNCYSLKHLNGLRGLVNLRYLNLHECVSLEEIDDLRHITNVQEICLDRCSFNIPLDILEDLTLLERISASESGLFETGYQLNPLKNLRYLNLENSRFDDLSGLHHLPYLEELDISYISKLKNVEVIREMPSLRTLNIDVAEFPQERSILQKLKTLRALCLSRCGTVNQFDSLQYLPNLERLVLSGSETMERLDFIHVLPNLKELVVCYSPSLKCLKDLKGHKSLEYMSFTEIGSNLDVIPDGFDNISQSVELHGREAIEKYQNKLRQYYE